MDFVAKLPNLVGLFPYLVVVSDFLTRPRAGPCDLLEKGSFARAPLGVLGPFLDGYGKIRIDVGLDYVLDVDATSVAKDETGFALVDPEVHAPYALAFGGLLPFGERHGHAWFLVEPCTVTAACVEHKLLRSPLPSVDCSRSGSGTAMPGSWWSLAR